MVFIQAFWWDVCFSMAFLLNSFRDGRKINTRSHFGLDKKAHVGGIQRKYDLSLGTLALNPSCVRNIDVSILG